MSHVLVGLPNPKPWPYRMPAAFIRSATNSFSTPSAMTTAPLTRAKAMVACIAAFDPIRFEVMVRLRPSLRYSLPEAASSSRVE